MSKLAKKVSPNETPCRSQQGVSSLSKPAPGQERRDPLPGCSIRSARRGRLTTKEILDAFPDEARALVPKKIARIQRIISKYKKWVNAIQKKNWSDFDKWFVVEVSLALYAPHKEVNWLADLKKINAVLLRAKETDWKVTPSDILRAKDVPVMSVIECKRKGARYWANCPLHGEDTPSFVVNKDNTYHCFGCGAHGDVIDLVMKLNGLTFIESVKYLLRI